MAIFKVWLTVRDNYGNIKELDGGNINVNLEDITEEDIDQIKKALPLEEYIKRENLGTELDEYATDLEVEDAVKQTSSIKYSDLKLRPEN